LYCVVTDGGVQVWYGVVAEGGVINPSGVAGVNELLGVVEVEESAETVTASFMPCEQCADVPQMKYRVPGALRVILVFWFPYDWIALDAEQVL
jgi:hypothetical protein